MKAEELRIGNYVQSIGIEYEVISVNKKGDIKGWDIGSTEGSTTFNLDNTTHPIPLTEEWLVKFGFDFNDDLEGYTLKCIAHDTRELNLHFDLGIDNIIRIYTIDDFKEYNWFNILENNKYVHVHQLQNLYFALTGEELTIKE